MPGHYLQSLLGERENIIMAIRHHWFILVSSIILEIVLILIIFSATLFGTITLTQNQSPAALRLLTRYMTVPLQPQFLTAH